MIAAPSFIKLQQREIFPALLLAVTLSGALFCFPSSYLFHSHVLVGLCLIPFSVFITGGPRNNYLYLATAWLFGTIALVYGLRIAYFFTLAFYLLWLMEFIVGRGNMLIVFLLGFMSPVFTHIVTILGFPIRLQISKAAGHALQWTGLEAVAEGNLIVVDGTDFSVDEACMGLNMLAMSMLVAVFIIGYRYRSSKKTLSFFSLILFFLMVFSLNLITNLCRIVLLVLFRIPPEAPMHEWVGLACFLFYTIVPIYMISAWLIRGTRGSGEIRPGLPLSLKSLPGYRGKVPMLAMSMLILWVGLQVREMRDQPSEDHVEILFAGGTTECLDDDITKASNDQVLIYVKPIQEWFAGEHSPLICWRGSGYVFDNIREDVVAGRQVYMARLTKGADELYTSWWYSNGTTQTNSQVEWRTRMVKGEPKFCLVNVTAKDEQTLAAGVESLFTANPLTIAHTKK